MLAIVSVRRRRAVCVVVCSPREQIAFGIVESASDSWLVVTRCEKEVIIVVGRIHGAAWIRQASWLPK